MGWGCPERVHLPRQHHCQAPNIQIFEPMGEFSCKPKHCVFGASLSSQHSLEGDWSVCRAVCLQDPQPVFHASVSCTECFPVHAKCGEPLRKSQDTESFSPLMVMEWTTRDDGYLFSYPQSILQGCLLLTEPWLGQERWSRPISLCMVKGSSEIPVQPLHYRRKSTMDGLPF